MTSKLRESTIVKTVYQITSRKLRYVWVGLVQLYYSATGTKIKKLGCSTGNSREVTHPITNLALMRLTTKFNGTWYSKLDMTVSLTKAVNYTLFKD